MEWTLRSSTAALSSLPAQPAKARIPVPAKSRARAARVKRRALAPHGIRDRIEDAGDLDMTFEPFVE
jgi:hypothetical protein